MNALSDLLKLQESYTGAPVIEWMREHTEIPIFVVTCYLGMVFYVPTFLENYPPFKLKVVFAFWNLILSVFSTIGVYYTVPTLLMTLYNKGYHYTICQHPKDWYFDGPTGLWVMLFILSKIPELLDTVFLVIQKKKVIFLHWFHHCTVMLYCWHSYTKCISTGLWFASMNYFVHSLMYTYYFLMCFELFRPIVKKVAKLITTLQLAQMLVGMSVTIAAFLKRDSNNLDQCFIDPANNKMGLAMYSAYFVLFAFLFKDLYCSGSGKGGRGRGGKEKSDQTESICGVKTDRTDTFRFFNNEDRVKEKSN